MPPDVWATHLEAVWASSPMRAFDFYAALEGVRFGDAGGRGVGGAAVHNRAVVARAP